MMALPVKFSQWLALAFYALNCILGAAQYQGDDNLSFTDIMKLCEGNNLKAVPYPGNESRYIVCNYYEPVIRSCYEDQCFNEEHQNCSKTCSWDYTKSVSTYCQQHGLGMMTFLPADDCGHYYICMGADEAIYGTCPEGLHFSRELHVCMSPVEAGCASLAKSCDGKQEGYRYAATECFQYYECRKGQATLLSCSYGESYDKTAGRCITDQRLECTNNSQRKPACTAADDGQRFSHANCDKYYVCIGAVLYEAQCAANYHYDAANFKCTQGSCT